MILFILGTLTGITICIFIAILYKRFDTAIQRTISQTSSKIQPKGEILEPQNESLAQWINTLDKSQ